MNRYQSSIKRDKRVKAMNYSEMVERYAAKIEWSKKPMGGTTASR